MRSATAATMIEPTRSVMIPYQSCQKLAVIQFVPKRNEVIARYAGTGSFGFQARSRSETLGSWFRYRRVVLFHCSKDSWVFGFVNCGGFERRLSIFAFIPSAIFGNFSSAERSADISAAGSTGEAAPDSPSACETAAGAPAAINASRNATA